MTPRWFPAGATIVLLLTHPFATGLRAEPNGVIEDLGTLGLDSYALAVNGSGQAVGSSLVTASDSRGFRTGAGVLDPVPTFGGSESAANGLNDAGVIVGFSRTADATPRAFQFDPATSSLLDLGDLGGGYAFAYGVNAAGVIVGYAGTADGLEEAFAWTAGDMQSLGTLGGVVSWAYGINDAGQVVGASHTSDDAVRAFLYSGGAMQDLGTLGGLDSVALAINAAGVVTGSSQRAGFGTRAFRYTSGGGMQELPSLGGAFTSGEAIAPDGTIVGFSTTPEGAVRAVRWTAAGDLEDLNTRIDPALGWTLVEATGINGAGQIVGYGSLGGVTRAFRLTLPVESGGVAPTTIHSVTATPSVLWPANHKLIPVRVEVSASDPSGAVPPCQITGITTNEPGANDVVVDGPWDLRLRASRLGTGAGRVYRIDVACGSGPDATATGFVEVTVPRSQAGGVAK